MTNNPPSNLSELTQPDVPSEQVQKDEKAPIEKSNKKLFVVGAIITGVIIVLAVGFFLSQRQNISPTPSPTFAPTTTASPQASPQAVLNRAKWSFEVLNGSEVPGSAKKVADQLKDLGYQVIKTGNADKDTYEITQIFVKSEFKDRLDLVIEDIKDIVKIASLSGELKDSTASAQIILGKL